MHHQRGLVRAACTARNAYSPALALASALSTSNNTALKLYARPDPFPAQHVQQRRLSRSRDYSASQNAGAQIDDGGIGTEAGVRQQKTRKKGTFTGYDALMYTIGDGDPQDEGRIADDQVLRDTRDAASSPKRGRTQRGLNGEQLEAGRRHPTQIRLIDPTKSKSRLSEAQSIPGKPARRPNRFQTAHVPRNASRQMEAPIEEATERASARSAENQNQGPNSFGFTNKPTPKKEDASAPSPERPYVDEVASTRGWQAQMLIIANQAHKFAETRSRLSIEQEENIRQRLDYTGISIAPAEPSLDSRWSSPWAQDLSNHESNGALEILDRDIISFGKFMQPSPAESAARQAVKEELIATIKHHIKVPLDISFSGSDVTGLSTAISDIDIQLRLTGEEHEGASPDIQAHAVGKRMRTLHSRMRSPSSNWIAVSIRMGNYPIINAQHRETGIDVQIVGSPSTQPQQAATLYFLNAIPHLKEVYLVLRSALAMRGLLDVFTGGPGSYGLFMMLVASLTRRGTTIPASPGAMLLQFLDFYTTHDFTRHGIAVARPRPATHDHDPTTLFPKHDTTTIPRRQYIRAAYARAAPIRAAQWSMGQRRRFQPYLPCIQDPATPLNDLGRKMNAIRHLVATLRTVRAKLRGRMGMLRDGKLRAEQTLLAPVVGRCHEVYFERRRRVEEFGREREGGKMDGGEGAESGGGAVG